MRSDVVKRAFDVALAMAGLAVLAPLLAVLALLVKLDSRGPVLFRQERVGRFGKRFRIHKFRTMCVATASSGQLITVDRDPRITRFGHLLRRYKLDELPQLIDVLAGDMSFVGPRPEVPRYVEHYPATMRAIILSVRPGITDLASIAFIDEATLLASSKNAEAVYVEQILPKKLEYYKRYVETRTFGLDLKIILRTLCSVVRR